MKNIKNEYLKETLTKMCEVVGADYTSIDFKSKDWFLKYSWTTEQENEFKNWLINYLKKSREARNSLMEWPHIKDNHNLQKFADSFVFNYGWKVKDV
jgi:hypothetical protein